MSKMKYSGTLVIIVGTMLAFAFFIFACDIDSNGNGNPIVLGEPKYANLSDANALFIGSGITTSLRNR